MIEKKLYIHVDIEKTEEYNVRKKGAEEWKKCKYPGSHFDTETDINRRKGLT